MALLLLGLLISLALVEVGLRVRQRLKYGTTFSYYEFVVHEPSGLRIPAPGTDAGPLQVNSLGFRGPEIELPKPPGRIRLAFLGGSTTFCAEASSRETTWPHLVVEALRAAHPEREFDYVNGGAGGFTADDSRRSLIHRVRPLEPDVLVVYHASNDLVVQARRLAKAEGLWDDREAELSWLADHWLTWNMIEKNLRSRAAQSTSGRRLEVDPAALAAPFREDVAALLEECRATAPVAAVATFCQRARRGQTAEERRAACVSSLYYMPFMPVPAILDAFEEYNRVLRSSAAEQGAILIECEEAVPADGEHFNDSIHFLDPGCRLFAERVAAGIEAAPAFRALLASRD